MSLLSSIELAGSRPSFLIRFFSFSAYAGGDLVLVALKLHTVKLAQVRKFAIMYLIVRAWFL